MKFDFYNNNFVFLELRTFNITLIMLLFTFQLPKMNWRLFCGRYNGNFYLKKITCVIRNETFIATISFFLTRFSLLAWHQWVTSETLLTRAMGHMMNNLAYGVKTTTSWTRVVTFHPFTRPVQRAIAVERTFRTTQCIGVSVELRKTYTSCNAIMSGTFGVCTAWVRVASRFGFF